MAETGDRIGAYEVVRLIARGGMTTVYEARQPALDRVIALKQFHLQADPMQLYRFIRESRTYASLHHPNIVVVYDFFESDAVPYIAMEYLARGSLRRFVGRLTLVQVFGVLEGMLAALAHAEQHGVVHGDLKPENVLITRGGGVKIADFGIAQAYMRATSLFEGSSMAVGTPNYMAPEQAMAEQVGPFTDLYAVGVIAYELLSGAPPFASGESPVAVMYKHVSELPPPLTDVDPRLAAWVARLLAKAPEARPPGAAQAWAEVEELVVDTYGPYWHREAALDKPSAGTADEYGTVVGDVQSAPPEPVLSPDLPLGPRELQRILRRAARTGIVPAERPVRHRPSHRPGAGRMPPSEWPAPPHGVPAERAEPRRPLESTPPPAAPVPDERAERETEPPPHAARRRRLGGWLSVQGLIFAAVAGGIGYWIIDRLLGSTMGRFESSPAPTDDVACTVFAPPTVAPDESFLVQAFVHLPEQADDVRALALEMDTAAARRVFRSLEAPIPRGSRLHFELHAHDCEIDDPVTSLVWRGRPEAVQFGVTVPPNATGTVIATLYVSLDSAPLGHVKFKLVIDPSAALVAARAAAVPEPQGEDARRYRAAFISYASKDRDKVLQRVQMLPLVGVRYFQDVLNLEPGDRWQRRLELGIDQCDLFLLFWSGEAKQSTWVRQEVGHALKRRAGDDLAEPEIKPVIIEGPPVSKPWAELAHLHFDERVLYFMHR